MDYSFIVAGDRLMLQGEATGNAGNTNTYTGKFDFLGGAWNGYSKVAVFHCAGTQPIEVNIEDNLCVFPAACTQNANNFYVGVYGVKDDKRISTNLIPFDIGNGAAINVRS